MTETPTPRTEAPDRPDTGSPVAGPIKRAYLMPMRWVRRTVLVLLGLLAGPVAVLVGGDVLGSDWRTASREPANIAPDPLTTKEAVVHVYAARTFTWRGAFGVHTWISVKPTAASTYTIYEVIGWRGYGGHSVLTVHNGIPDRYWFGRRPALLAELRGDGVDDIIRRIDVAARRTLISAATRPIPARTATPSPPGSPATCRNCGSICRRRRSARITSATA